MTITSIVEKEDSPSCTAESGKTTVNREWWAYSDSVNDGPVTVIAAMATAGVSIGQHYYYGSGPFEVLWTCKCSKLNATRDEHLQGYWRWNVRADYETPEKGEQPTPEPNPLDRPVQISGGTVEAVRNVQRDRDDDPIKNTANDLYPPVEKRDSDFQVTFVRNEASSPAAICEEYTNKVNENPIWGGDAGTWFCNSITYVKQFEDIYTYWQVTYVFTYREDKHVLELTSNGFNEIDGGQKKAIKLEDGTKPSEPQPLDAAGAWVDDPADAEVQEFYLYEEIDFNDLGLPGVI